MNKKFMKLKYKMILLSFILLVFSPNLIAYEKCNDGGGVGIYDFDSGGCLKMSWEDYMLYLLGPFKYDGDNSGFGAYTGAIVGGSVGSAAGSGITGAVGGFVGGSIGAAIGDSIEGKANSYAEDKWNKKPDNSTSWRSVKQWKTH